MLSYANVLTRIKQLLQDPGGAIFETTETSYAIEDGLKYFSNYKPVFLDVLFQVESRYGTDVTGTASSLTDAVKNQFLSTDDDNEKVVHNTTDDTWAVVKTATASTSVLTLTANIMASGESYEIYNKRCRNKRQIYIGDMPSYLWIESVEYPLGTKRNFDLISEDVLELDVRDSTILDSNSTLTRLNKVDVLVKFAVPQVLCQLTLLTGAVHTEGAAKATSLVVKSFTDAEIIEVGEMFNIADHLTTYIVTTELTLVTQTGVGATLVFYPGLEATALANSAITFVKTSLRPQYEDLACRCIAAKAAMSKSALPLQQTIEAISILISATGSIDDMTARITQAINDITSGRTETDKSVALISTSATAEIALMNPEIDKALLDLEEGRLKIDESNKGGPGVPSDFINYAGANIANARGYLLAAQGYIQQARADEELANNYGQLAARELNNASQQSNQAMSYLRQIASSLQVAGAWRHYRDWGEREMARVEIELRRLADIGVTYMYPRT